MSRFQVYVHEVVGLWVEVEAETKREAREKAGNASDWLDWQEVPDVIHIWVPRAEAAAPAEETQT